MTDTITLPRVTVQQALAALESGLAFSTHSDVLQNLRAALKQQAEPVAWPHKWGCRANAFGECSMGCTTHPAPTQQQAEPVQEPFDDLATELFVVAQISPADDGFSDTIDRIESWLREHFSTPPQRKELSAGEILNMMPSTIPAQYDGELMEFARAVETKIKEGT